MGTPEAIQKYEERTGQKCYVYAEFGKFLGKNIVPNDGSKNFARFSISRFGITQRIVYGEKLLNQKSNGKFTLRLGINDQCNGEYSTFSGIAVTLKCDINSKRLLIENGIFKGIDAVRISWC